MRKLVASAAAACTLVPLLVSAQISCPNLTRTLQLNDTGADVKALQQFLLEQGLLNALQATSFFNIATEQALQKWQSNHGLVSAGSPLTTGWGVAGPKTRALIAACGKAPTVSPVPRPTVPPTTSAQTGARTLSFGMRGSDVTALQNYLIQNGFLAAGNNSGYFGVLTQAAVQAFQKARGIVSSGSPATTGYGAVGPKTRAEIAKFASKPANPSPAPLPPPSPISKPYSPTPVNPSPTPPTPPLPPVVPPAPPGTPVCTLDSSGVENCVLQ